MKEAKVKMAFEAWREYGRTKDIGVIVKLIEDSETRGRSSADQLAVMAEKIVNAHFWDDLSKIKSDLRIALDAFRGAN